MANTEVSNTTPDREAYNAYPAGENENPHGRFASNLANIRKFKSNPYIKDLDEADLFEANKTLLTPYEREQFVDDDGFVYVCFYVKDPLTGETHYEYISHEKNLMKILDEYKQTGVQNQLMSAYNNGRIYKFYVDRTNLTMYPDSSLVFPENYEFYTVRKQSLNANKEHVYVAGLIEDGELSDMHIAMKRVKDTAMGTSYTRMSAASVFEIENASGESRYDQIVSGEFYVVEFYDKNGFIVDTKLFQAQDSVMTDMALPSKAVVGLRVSVLRQGMVQDSSNGVYPMLTGEAVDTSVAFSVRAVYSDGTIKDITDKLDTPWLSKVWDVEPTSTATVGSRFTCTFNYYPNLDEARDFIGNAITADVTFQVVENASDEVYKLIPVIWNATSSNFAGDGVPEAKIYKLKLYKMSNTGMLSNVTRAFYNTMKVFDANTSKFVDFNDCSYSYDPYEQCVLFVWNNGNYGTTYLFQFQLWSSGVQKSYQFFGIFGSNPDNLNGVYVRACNIDDDFGYEKDGPFYTLKETYSTKVSDSNAEILSNTIKLGMGNNAYQFTLKSYTQEEFATRYKKKIEGTVYKANAVQLFAVKDDTETPISRVFVFGASDDSIVIPAVNADRMVESIVSSLRNYDWILAKYYNQTRTETTLVNFDVYAVTRSI